jgi:hypothetical protein
MKLETQNKLIWWGGIIFFSVACTLWMRFLFGRWPR